jgi:hypothetical protein
MAAKIPVPSPSYKRKYLSYFSHSYIAKYLFVCSSVMSISFLLQISDLKVQVTKERSSKHAVAQQLSSFRQESAKLLQQKQKIWESKFRELQKQKHALSAKLQVFFVYMKELVMMTMNIVPCTSARLQATLGTFNANY